MVCFKKSAKRRKMTNFSAIWKTETRGENGRRKFKSFPVLPSIMSVLSCFMDKNCSVGLPDVVSATPLFLPRHLGPPGSTTMSTRQHWLPGLGPSAVVGQPRHPAWDLLRPCPEPSQRHIHPRILQMVKTSLHGNKYTDFFIILHGTGGR